MFTASATRNNLHPGVPHYSDPFFAHPLLSQQADHSLALTSGREDYQAGQLYGDFFNRHLNPALSDGIEQSLKGNETYTAYDPQYRKTEEEAVNVNLHVLPLRDSKEKSLGVVIIADDITQEQRLMSALSRYVTRQVAGQILKDREKLAGAPGADGSRRETGLEG